MRIGRALFWLQIGERLGMPHARPMPVVAAGASELRIRGGDGIYRTFYYAANEASLLVLHAFVKKTQDTPPDEIEITRKGLKELTHG